METITQSMKRATLSEHYAEIRKRLGDRRTPARPIIPIDRIKPRESDQDAAPPALIPIALPEPKEPLPLPRLAPDVQVTILPPRRSRVILEEVAARHGMRVEEMTQQSRKRRYTYARQEAYYLLRQAGYSWPQCAKFCGNLDHTTAIHGAQQYEARLKRENENND